MIDWYLKVVRDNYANFSGRARRSEYWYYALCGAIIGMVLKGVDYAIGLEVNIVGTLYSLAVFIPGLAVAVRRLHDIGKSGWYFLIIMLPIILGSVMLGVSILDTTPGFTVLRLISILLFLGGGIWMIVVLCKEGDAGSNEYGEDPKRPDDFLNEIGSKEVY